MYQDSLKMASSPKINNVRWKGVSGLAGGEPDGLVQQNKHCQRRKICTIIFCHATATRDGRPACRARLRMRMESPIRGAHSRALCPLVEIASFVRQVVKVENESCAVSCRLAYLACCAEFAGHQRLQSSPSPPNLPLNFTTTRRPVRWSKCRLGQVRSRFLEVFGLSNGTTCRSRLVRLRLKQV